MNKIKTTKLSGLDLPQETMIVINANEGNMQEIHDELAKVFISKIKNFKNLDRIDKPTPFNPNDVKPKTQPHTKNHRMFIVDGVEIWALSEKRAVEKYHKKYGK